MPSFDVVSQMDAQEIDNAVNNARKELSNRYDFRNTKFELEFDRKEKTIRILAHDQMKMDSVREVLLNHAARRNVDLKVFDFADPEPTSHGQLKRTAKIKEGIPQDVAKKMVKMVKDAKMKVQASIQGEELRVTGKKLDDLQEVIAMFKSADLGLPLQFVNMKS